MLGPLLYIEFSLPQLRQTVHVFIEFLPILCPTTVQQRPFYSSLWLGLENCLWGVLWQGTQQNSQSYAISVDLLLWRAQSSARNRNTNINCSLLSAEYLTGQQEAYRKKVTDDIHLFRKSIDDKITIKNSASDIPSKKNNSDLPTINNIGDVPPTNNGTGHVPPNK